MDSLEKYIQNHREEFEQEGPDPKVWDKLEHRLWEEEKPKPEKQKIIFLNRNFRKWAAVAAVFLLGITFVAFVRTYQVKKEALQQVIPSDLLQAKAFYKAQINNEITRIKGLQPQKSSFDSSFLQLFNDNDAEYDRLTSALRENPDNPHVRAAFVEYYRSRLEVLKRIHKRLEEHINIKQ